MLPLRHDVGQGRRRAGRPFNPPPFLSGFIIWGPVLVTKYRLFVLVVTVVILAALWLFLQGTRDALAERALLDALAARLGARATLSFVEDADHAFHVPAHSGRTDAEVRRALLHTAAAWIGARS